MAEKIISISEETFSTSVHGYRQSYDGYIIKTDEKEIKFGVDNSQCCCESWGYICSDDNFDDYVGSEFIGVNITDTDFNTVMVDDIGSLDCGDCIFMTLNTSKGSVQFAVYNSHNGYYGHTALLIVDNEIKFEAIV